MFCLKSLRIFLSFFPYLSTNFIIIIIRKLEMLSIIYYTISSTKFHSDNNFGIIFPPIPFYHEEFNVLIEKKAFVLLIDISVFRIINILCTF